jgi:hypothetical protein
MSALHIVVSEHHDSQLTTVTSILIETATVLPNTRQSIHNNGTRVLHVAEGDLRRHPELAEEIRELTHEYEQLLEEQEESSAN